MKHKSIEFGVCYGILIIIIVFTIYYTKYDSFHAWPRNIKKSNLLGTINGSLNHSPGEKVHEMEEYVAMETDEDNEQNQIDHLDNMETTEEKYDIDIIGENGDIQNDNGFEDDSFRNSSVNNTTSEDLVPNLVHYVWLDMNDNLKFEFIHAVSFISVHKRWKPDKILIHVYEKRYPQGEWWDYVKKNVTEIKIVEHGFDELKIYGKVPKYVEHMSDILRINILKEYGGTYIDTDVVALRSLEPLRHYDHVQGLGILSSGLSNGVIIAKNTSIFLQLWHEAYRTYNEIDLGAGKSLWRYYSIQLPRTLVNLYPHLIHIEKDTLIRPTKKFYTREKVQKFVWENNFSVHIWHRVMKVPKSPDEIPDLPNDSLLKEVMEYIWFDKPPPLR